MLTDGDLQILQIFAREKLDTVRCECVDKKRKRRANALHFSFGLQQSALYYIYRWKHLFYTRGVYYADATD